MTRLFPLLIALSGCAPSVIAAYEADRLEALADPGPPPEDWEPDAVLTVADDLVNDAVSKALHAQGAMDGTIDVGLLTARPTLDVKKVTLTEGGCQRCGHVDARLAGQVAVDTPLGSVEVPVKARLAFIAVFAVTQKGSQWTLTVDTRKIESIDLKVAGTDMAALTEPLVEWVAEALRQSGPIPMADLGSSDLPIRAMRVLPRADHLRLELLTATPTPVSLAEVGAVPEEGWQLDLSTDAMFDLARAAAHRSGPIAREIVAVPTSLDLREDRFYLGLRLWRVKGRGWWRDYSVEGAVAVEDGRIHLTPESVEDEGHSQGAAWADPLAALGQGVILKSLERALETSAPGTHRTRGEDVRFVVHIEEVEGRGATVSASGDLVVRTP